MKNSDLTNRIASQRMAMLLSFAESRMKEKGDSSRRLARRYVELAKRISSHYQIAIPKEFRSRICRNCGNILIPGLNCGVRMSSSHGYMAYVCECGEERHIFYKKK